MRAVEVICLICTVVVVIVIFFSLFLILLEIHSANQRAEIARQKCDEYAKLSCDQPTSKNILHLNSSHIMGGTYVPDGILPHMVYVQMEKGACSGSLISEYFVMTAAHCVSDMNETQVLVIMSSVNLYNGTLFKIDEIHVHPDYNHTDGSTRAYDIALLKLYKKVEFDWKTRPICLNTDFESISTAKMTASGWGIDEYGNESENLRIVDTYIDGQILTRCILEFGARDVSLMVCAGHPTEQKSTCQGDSGGPLQIPLKDGCPNTYEQIGITSGGRRYCTPGVQEPLLGMYTKVELMLPWVVGVVWQE